MEKNKKIILHVGSPKTATTFIQSSLDNNKLIFNNFGYDIMVPNHIRGTNFYLYIHLKHVNKQPSIAEKEARENFQSIISGFPNENIILSEEGILHNLMPSELTNGAFGGVENAAKAIKNIIKNDTTIILTIRNQVNFIESTYKHKIKWKLCSLTFEEFLARHIKIKKLSWKSVIDTLEKYFPGKVKVIPYELIKISQKKYFNQFLRSCGIANFDQQSAFLLDNNVKNKAMSDNQALFMQLLNKAYKETASVKLKKAWEIYRFTEELFKDEPSKKLSAFKINNELANEIKNYYREENIEILNNYCSRNELLKLLEYY